ncbi:hypothetical protein N9L68_05320 [bacterium]|nr:hypothetical protein [bacterium]
MGGGGDDDDDDDLDYDDDSGGDDDDTVTDDSDDTDDDDDEAISARASLWQPRRPLTCIHGGQCRSDAEGGTHEVCPKSRSPHTERGDDKLACSPRGASRLQGSGGGSAGAFSSTRR